MGNSFIIRSSGGTVALNALLSTGAKGDPGPSSGGAVASVNGSTGTVVLTQDTVGDGTTYKRYSATEKTKLSGIANNATANDTDANLKNRANHTGSLPLSALDTAVLLVATYTSGTPARPIAGSTYTVLWVCADAAAASSLPLVTSGTAGRYANDIITTKA